MKEPLKTGEVTNEVLDKKLENFVEILVQQSMDTAKDIKKLQKRVAVLEKQLGQKP